MKHYRPIKTFATWLLERVSIQLPFEGGRDWGGKDHEHWIEEHLELDRCVTGDLRANIYSHSGSGFPVAGRPHLHYFNFPTAEQADLFQATWGGVRSTETMKETARRNESIWGNFTADDMLHLYGDPLPNIVQYHLSYMQDHGGYFNRFSHMHQQWAHLDWVPGAFLHRDRQCQDDEIEVICWFADTLQHQVTPDDEHGWQRRWHQYASNVYEFDDPYVAKMFMLRFGCDPIPEKYRFRGDEIARKLVPHVSGIRHATGKGYIWERTASIPDYQSPLIRG